MTTRTGTTSFVSSMKRFMAPKEVASLSYGCVNGKASPAISNLCKNNAYLGSE